MHLKSGIDADIAADITADTALFIDTAAYITAGTAAFIDTTADITVAGSTGSGNKTISHLVNIGSFGLVRSVPGTVVTGPVVA